MTSKQIKLASIAVGLLVVLNIALIATIWLQRKPGNRPPGRPDAQRILVKELGLNASQVRSFDSLRSLHFKQMETYKQEMRKLKDIFFGGLSQPSPNTDSIALAIGGVQAKIEKSTFDHFAAVRKICTPEQQRKFDEIINDVLRSMGPGGPGGPDGPGPKP